MKNLISYEDFRLFESAGPLASAFKKAGFEEMSKADSQGFDGVQTGGLMYSGEDFIVIYGLSLDDSKPIVSVMYGDDPSDGIEAHILTQADQKAFASKLQSFSKEMDRLCALPAGEEKREGIKSWLKKFGFQAIQGSFIESKVNESLDVTDEEVLAYYDELVEIESSEGHESKKIELNPEMDTIKKFSHSGSDTAYITKLLKRTGRIE